jgi:hypothetical protein
MKEIIAELREVTRAMLIAGTFTPNVLFVIREPQGLSVKLIAENGDMMFEPEAKRHMRQMVKYAAYPIRHKLVAVIVVSDATFTLIISPPEMEAEELMQQYRDGKIKKQDTEALSTKDTETMSVDCYTRQSDGSIVFDLPAEAVSDSDQTVAGHLSKLFPTY